MTLLERVKSSDSSISMGQASFKIICVSEIIVNQRWIEQFKSDIILGSTAVQEKLLELKKNHSCSGSSLLLTKLIVNKGWAKLKVRRLYSNANNIVDVQMTKQECEYEM